ncbi:MAG TPA: SIMPL domain-containing protein [Acidimicrobiia bacterium]|nr:SIMPL domain-containing protein [Acidimicrobiia bacterium]
MPRFPQLFLGLAVLTGGLTVGAGALRDGLAARSRSDAITVTGSARRTIVSDTVVWRASLTSTQATPTEASKELTAWVNRVQAFLKGAGAASDEVRLNPVSTETTPVILPSGQTDMGRVGGYRLTRSFEVRSGRVKEITDIIQKSAGLLTEGIPLTAQPPEYLYAALPQLRPELLAEASTDAKNRGGRLVAAAGGHLGKLRDVSAGVFQITAPNSTDTSGGGVYDTSTIDKDVTAVVSLTFAMR